MHSHGRRVVCRSPERRDTAKSDATLTALAAASDGAPYLKGAHEQLRLARHGPCVVEQRCRESRDIWNHSQ